MPSAKWQPFCSDLNVLIHWVPASIEIHIMDVYQKVSADELARIGARSCVDTMLTVLTLLLSFTVTFYIYYGLILNIHYLFKIIAQLSSHLH